MLQVAERKGEIGRKKEKEKEKERKRKRKKEKKKKKKKKKQKKNIIITFSKSQKIVIIIILIIGFIDYIAFIFLTLSDRYTAPEVIRGRERKKKKWVNYIFW